MAGWWSAPRTPREFMTSHAPASVTEAWVFLLSLYVSVGLFPRERERERERERGERGSERDRQAGMEGGKEKDRKREREGERERERVEGEGEIKVHVVDSIISSVIMRFKKSSGIPSATTSCCKPLVPVNDSA